MCSSRGLLIFCDLSLLTLQSIDDVKSNVPTGSGVPDTQQSAHDPQLSARAETATSVTSGPLSTTGPLSVTSQEEENDNDPEPDPNATYASVRYCSLCSVWCGGSSIHAYIVFVHNIALVHEYISVHVKVVCGEVGDFLF